KLPRSKLKKYPQERPGLGREHGVALRLCRSTGDDRHQTEIASQIALVTTNTGASSPALVHERPDQSPSLYRNRAVSATGHTTYCYGSQNSTRRRTPLTNPLSTSPSTEGISSTENWPATSMVKFMLWISMPSPDCAPTNSATMAPISAKIMAISSPAKM